MSVPAPLSLAAEGLRFSYRRGFSLDVPALDVPAGTALAIIGPSGSGKSTLLSLLGLLERPSAGHVLLDGRPVTAKDRTARLAMAAVFQRPYLFKGSVAENVVYGLRLRGVSRAEALAAVPEVLHTVGLDDHAQRSALGLSGGEAQRVALARALVLRPQVLFLDEPLASLDPLLKRRITADFARILRDESVTTVYVTHDQDEAMVVADRLAVMNEGGIVACGPADEVMGLPHTPWVADFLGVPEALEGVVRSSEAGLVTVDCHGATVAAAGELEVGTRVRLGIRPEDVMLFEAHTELAGSSARNRMMCVVDAVHPRGTTHLVELRVGGVRIASSVSRAAVNEMSLAPGLEVLAVFKATAVRVRVES